MDSASLVSVLNLGTIRAYERQAVEDFLRAASAERERLIAAIAHADARAVAAAHVTAEAGALEAHLTGLIITTQDELAELRRRAREQVDEIAQAAQAEVEACLAAARTEVELLHSATEHLMSHADDQLPRVVADARRPSAVIDLRNELVEAAMRRSS